MKNSLTKLIAAVALFLIVATGQAQTNIELVILTGTMTNRTTGFGFLTVPGGGITNRAYTTVNSNAVITGDPSPVAFTHVNHSLLYLANAQTNLRSAMLTNLVFTATNLPSGTPPTVTNTGTIGGVAYYQIGIPAAAPNTNTVTAYNLSNAMFSSAQIILLDTNFNFALSNSLGRFTNVLKVLVSPPQIGSGGMAPPSPAPYTVIYSTNGTSGWTSNLTVPPNMLYVSVTTTTTGAGRVTIFSAEHPELDGRTNDLTRQHLLVAQPTGNADACTKFYCDVTDANVAANNWQLNSNGTSYFYGPNSARVFELQAALLTYSTNLSISLVNTNWVLTISATNFVAGWQLQFSPALELLNGFQLFTSYTLVTNTGIATFTVPLSATPSPNGFFRIVSPQTAGALSYWPLQMPYAYFGTNGNYPTLTVTHSTNTTYGYGSGLLTADTNYLYVSVGTNAWRRLAIPTNTW